MIENLQESQGNPEIGMTEDTFDSAESNETCTGFPGPCAVARTMNIPLL